MALCEWGLEAQASTGGQTGLSQFKESLGFVAPALKIALAPAFSGLSFLDGEGRFYLAGEASSYLDAFPDYNLEGGYALSHAAGRNRFDSEIFVKRISQTGIVDLDDPFEYQTAGLGLTYRLIKSNTLKVGWKGELLAVPGSGRKDFKHTLRPSFTLGFFKSIYPGLGLTLSQNISNSEEYNYSGFGGFPFLLWVMSERFYLTAFTDYSRRFYKKGIEKEFPNNGKRNENAPPKKSIVLEKIPISNNEGVHLYLSAQLSEKFELLAEYDFYFSQSDFWEGTYRSHYFGLGWVWSY